MQPTQERREIWFVSTYGRLIASTELTAYVGDEVVRLGPGETAFAPRCSGLPARSRVT